MIVLDPKKLKAATEAIVRLFPPDFVGRVEVHIANGGGETKVLVTIR